MGYYTCYSLKTDCEWTKEIEHAIENDCNISYGINSQDGTTRDSVKWYDHQEDMKEFSQKFPDVLFTLQAYGESNEDMSIKYFRNGKCQVCRAKITFDDFDPEKLE